MPAKRRLISVGERLPPTGQWVIAVTPHFRCMAYLDDRGKWRDVNRGEEVPNVTAWCPPDEENQK